MKNIFIIIGLIAIVLVTIFASIMYGLHTNDMTMDHKMMGHSMMNHEVNSELEFIVEMIPHHQEAVDSSKQLLELGTENNELKVLLEDVISAQEVEISMMNNWLNNWYENESFESNYVEMMPNLNVVNEENRDNDYLNGMIMHHQMAVVMAQSVLEIEDIRDETKELAQDIIIVQEQEIELMKSILN